MRSAARARTPDRGASASRLAGWLDGYRPPAGAADELLGPDGGPRPAWARFLGRLAGEDEADIRRRFGSAERHIRETGISYRVYGEEAERSWSLGPLPLLIAQAEWDALAAGIAQRASLLEAVLSDVYGEARTVADGTLPAAAIAGSPDFVRALRGVRPRGGRWLQLYAADLARGPDGQWRVIADRTQAPSGMGYALENRLVLSRAFPDLYAATNVERLAPFFQAFRQGLASAADREDPRICVLSPGPLSDTYVEQAYLARYLGFLLVEGDDLLVRDGRVQVRTIAGLKRADVLWRRVDSDFVDPLELNPASHLGVPGLLDALRDGTLVMGNMPGTGLVEAGAVAPYLPRLARRLLGEDLTLPARATWWCGDPEGSAHVLDGLDGLAIGPAHVPARAGAPAPDRDRLLADMRDRPADFVGQEPVAFSTGPVLDGEGLAPRPLVLRLYACATPDGWHVMPGGFCRIADAAGVAPTALGPGVTSADVWVVADAPVGSHSLLPRADEVRVRRLSGHLPSRAADNLFWLGRYVERGEAVIRLVRALLTGTAPDSGADRAGSKLRALLHSWGSIPAATLPLPQAAAAALFGPDRSGSAGAHMRAARRAASGLRERLSGQSWRALGELDAILGSAQPGGPPAGGDLLTAADRALTQIAALSGLAGENMNRAGGWHFLDMGRRIERAVNTCAFARALAGPDAGAEDLATLLVLADSQIAYGSRYILGVALAPVRDMVLLDPYNPRSVAFGIARVAEHLAGLPSLRHDGLPEDQLRLAARLLGDVETADAALLESAEIAALEDGLKRLADAIAARYFSGGPDASRPEKLTGLA